MQRRNPNALYHFRPMHRPHPSLKSDLTQNFFRRLKHQTIEENKSDNYRSKLINVRSQKVLQDPSRRQFNISRLNDSVKRVRNMRAQNSTYAWVSPLRAKECLVAEGEVLFTRGGGRQGKEQVRTLENAELHTVDINESMGSFGNFMCSQYEQRQTPRSKLQHKATLRKIFDQYQELVKLSKRVDTLRPLVLTSSQFKKRRQLTCPSSTSIIKPKYRSKSGNFSSNDPIALAFYSSNPHFQSTFRKQPPILSLLFSSLTPSSQTFNIHSLILYNTLFITKQASGSEKALFVAGLLFRKSQEELPVQVYKERLEEIVLTSKKLTVEKLRKLASSIFRITAGGVDRVGRGDLVAVLVGNTDIAEVIVSLLQVD